jgi:hypothetical protein
MTVEMLDSIIVGIVGITIVIGLVIVGVTYIKYNRGEDNE